MISFYPNTCHFHSDNQYFHPKNKENIDDGAIMWLWWLDVMPFLIVFMTGKMFWPPISFHIGQFLPRFQWLKSKSIVWKDNQRILEPFVLFFNTNVFNWGVSLVEKWNFLNSSIFIRIFILVIQFNSIQLYWLYNADIAEKKPFKSHKLWQNVLAGY